MQDCSGDAEYALFCYLSYPILGPVFFFVVSPIEHFVVSPVLRYVQTGTPSRTVV